MWIAYAINVNFNLLGWQHCPCTELTVRVFMGFIVYLCDIKFHEYL